MDPANRYEVSLYTEAKTALKSLVQQTATVFIGFIIILLFTRGTPSSAIVALCFCVGTIFIAWSEQRRIRSLRRYETTNSITHSQNPSIDLLDNRFQRTFQTKRITQLRDTTVKYNLEINFLNNRQSYRDAYIARVKENLRQVRVSLYLANSLAFVCGIAVLLGFILLFSGKGMIGLPILVLGIEFLQWVVVHLLLPNRGKLNELSGELLEKSPKGIQLAK